jgi:hypothetical protein
VDDGFVVRQMPDGGIEFVLEERLLDHVCIDHWSRLRFGSTEVAIRTPFSLEHAGLMHRLDPNRRDALGPLLSLFPGSLRWLWTSAVGELAAVFVDGSVMHVSPHPVSSAWSVGDVSSLPAGVITPPSP